MLRLLSVLLLCCICIKGWGGDESHKMQQHHHAVVPFVHELQRQVKQDARCAGMNSTTVMMTAVTHHQFDLLVTQRNGMKMMKPEEDGQCLMHKLIVICLDTTCVHRCKLRKFTHCTYYHHSEPIESEGGGGPAEYKQISLEGGVSQNTSDSHWTALTHKKWEFFSLALKFGAQVTLWLDADVILLKNPFLDLARYADTKGLLHLSNTKNIHEEKDDLGCDNPPHSGLLILSIATSNYRYLALQLVNHMLEADHKQKILSGEELEMDVLNNVMHEIGIAHCSLPKARYAGHCKNAHLDNYVPDDVVAFHADCPSDENKVEAGRGDDKDIEQITSKKDALLRHFISHLMFPNVNDTNAFNVVQKPAFAI